MNPNVHAPCFSNEAKLRALPVRDSDYWNILEYCRHIGFSNRTGKERHWVARVRLKNGRYRQQRIGLVRTFHKEGINYSEAICAARRWFATPEVQAEASEPYKVGPNTELKYDKKTTGFTVGDAMRDYVEWKRVAAAKTHFETNLSLINFHIIPRIGDVRLEDFSGRIFTEFCLDVLKTPPKRGKQRLQQKRPLESLDHEALRRRKKTVNALIGILRLAFRMAWENGEVESERPWRCLRRIPHADVPRQHFLTRRECQRLIEACSTDLSELIMGALYTGCRVSELARLQVRDVGRTFFGIYVGPQKSWRGRYVHLPDEGMSFFLDLCEGKSDEERVFLRANGKSWQPTAHSHLFRSAVARAGLPSGFVFHGLRHTYASQLVQAGTPLAIIARQLGHSNTDTVSRTYGHLSCQSIEEELSRRFAPLRKACADPRLKKIRSSLQSCEPLPESSWPKSNFFKSGGDLVALIRTLEPRGGAG